MQCLYGIAALTHDQAKLFQVFGHMWESTYRENFDNAMTTDFISSIIASYKELGLLDHLNEDSIGEALNMMGQYSINDVNELPLFFPNLTHYMDVELTNIDNPYEELLTAYELISKGAFNLSRIQDNFDIAQKKGHVTFEIDGKPNKISYDIEGDWLDDAIISKLDQIVEQLDLDGRFYLLESDGVHLIYLNEKQYKFLAEEEFLSFTDNL